MAKECGVTRRTIFRDLGVLRQAGIPLTFDATRQLHLIRGTPLVQSKNFSKEEAFALVVLYQSIAAIQGQPLHEPSLSAMLRVLSGLGANLREFTRTAAAAVKIMPSPFAVNQIPTETFLQIEECITARRCIRIEYQGPTDPGVFSTKLSPYSLMLCRNSWYVVGRSSLHRAVRTFHVGRLKSIVPLTDNFVFPRNFDISRHLRNAWNMIPEPGRDRHVHLRFSKLVAKNVADVQWHRNQCMEFRGDGQLDFHVLVSGLNEISWWILGYGDQVQVIEPAELRNIVVKRIMSVAQLYQGAVAEPIPTKPSKRRASVRHAASNSAARAGT